MPFLGANRTALIAGWGPQGPDYKASITFPMVMALETTGEMPKYSVQRSSSQTGISNTNYFDGWTAATIDKTDQASWNRYAMTSIYTVRVPSGWFEEIWPSGGSNSFQSNEWREDSSSTTFSDSWSIGQDSSGIVVFSYSGSGVFVDTKIFGDPGTVTAATLEDRWISIICTRGARTGFSNYNSNQGTDTYGARVYIRDAVTNELLYARDMTTFSGWSTNPPDITTYAGTITASDHNSTTTLDWRCDQWGLAGGGYTGNIDFAQIWLAPGAQVDPATNSDWVSNGIPTTISGKTAWIHGTFTDVTSTGAVSGFTYISTSPSNYASQADDKILLAGGNGAAQLPFTNTVYPGS